MKLKKFLATTALAATLLAGAGTVETNTASAKDPGVVGSSIVNLADAGDMTILKRDPGVVGS